MVRSRSLAAHIGMVARYSVDVHGKHGVARMLANKVSLAEGDEGRGVGEGGRGVFFEKVHFTL